MIYCPSKFLSSAALITLLLANAAPAFAAAPDGAGPWADSVLSSSQGLMKNGSPVPAARSNPTAALGVAENNTVDTNFFSLGFGGNIALGFDNGISNGAVVIEATNPGYPNETAKVEMSENGTDWVLAGNVTQDGTVNKPESIACARYVRVTDTSDPANFSDATADAYDVDGVMANGDPCKPPTGGGNCGCPPANVTQTNTSNITIGINSKSNTGKNKTKNNTGGNTTVTTGNATSNTTVAVVGGINVVTGTGCCCDGGNSNVTISNNGAGSTNTVTINKKKGTL